MNHAIKLDSGFDAGRLDWAMGEGLLPAVVQHATTGEVLMLGYMNAAALGETLRCGNVTFFSRSRQRLWTKGETSGHVLQVRSIHADCDRDALLVMAEPQGPTCHLGTTSCFGDSAGLPMAFLARIDGLVARRARERPPDSYTTRLLEAGVRRIAQKVGEEGVETALAAVAESDEALLGEAADLVYHLVVLLRSRGLSLADVASLLAQRHRQVSGEASA